MGGSYGVNYLILHQKPEKALMPTFVKNMSSIRICFGFEDLTCCAIVLGDELAKYAYKLPRRKAFYSDGDMNGYLYTNNLTGQIRKYIEPSIKIGHRTFLDDLKKLEKNNPPKPDSKDIKSNVSNIPIPQETESKIIPQDKGTLPIPNPLPNQIQNEIIKEINKNEEKDSIIPKNNDKIIENINKNQQIPLRFDNVDPIIIQKQQTELENNIKNIPNFIPYIPPDRLKNIKIIDKTIIDLSKTEKSIKRKEDD
jgi:S-DNA-T family DNA segregation ATPase FtsK/SpoIIIE